MKQAAAKQTTTPYKSGSKPEPSGMVIALQLLDTAWRVAIPIIIFTYFGVKFDKNLHTTPLYSVIGLLLALSFATLLVYRQIKLNYPEFFSRSGKDKKS